MFSPAFTSLTAWLLCLLRAAPMAPCVSRRRASGADLLSGKVTAGAVACGLTVAGPACGARRRWSRRFAAFRQTIHFAPDRCELRRGAALIVVEPSVERARPDHPDDAVSLNNCAVSIGSSHRSTRPPSGAAGREADFKLSVSNNDPAESSPVFVGSGDIHGPWQQRRLAVRLLFAVRPGILPAPSSCSTSRSRPRRSDRFVIQIDDKKTAEGHRNSRCRRPAKAGGGG
jgi:hypothetical protein